MDLPVRGSSITQLDWGAPGSWNMKLGEMVSLVRRPAWGDESSLNFSTTYLSVLGDGPSYQLRSDGRNTSVGPIILQNIQIKLIIIIHCSTFLENVNFLLVASKLSINSYSIAVKVSK